METIEYLMADPRQEQDVRFFASMRRQPDTVRFLWHGAQVRLHCVPGAWMGAGSGAAGRSGEKNGDRACGGREYGEEQAYSGGPAHGRTEELRRRLLAGKLERYLQSGLLPREGLWVAPELEAFFPKYEQPFPGPGLAAWILHNQPFRQILAVLLDPAKQEREDRLWLERFLELCFSDLNGLYLVNARTAEGGQMPSDGDFFDWLYEQSGLPACFTDRLPETDGRETAVVDLRRRTRPPVREMAFGSLYLDLTSQPYRQRLMGERRPDISCISARNYLDTAFKARYNAI